MPRTLGHEAAGVIAEVGPGVSNLEVGERVRLNPNLSCRRCDYCLTDREHMCAEHSIIGQNLFGPAGFPMYEKYHNGALAQYVLAPSWAVDKLPEEISFDVAAKIHDVSNAVHALRVADPRPGSTVVVTAATGAMGAAIARVAPLFGVHKMLAVARSQERLAEIAALAPDVVETLATDDLSDNWQASGELARELKKRVAGGPEYVIDFLPDGGGTWQAFSSMRNGGTGVVMGTSQEQPPIGTVALMLNCWQIKGTRNGTRRDTKDVMRWMVEGALEIDDLITHRFPLSEVAQATKTVWERREPTWMVVVNP
jgi:threonine dehydrogenase-like Zn-dependent dehydrogenase